MHSLTQDEMALAEEEDTQEEQMASRRGGRQTRPARP
jgi:hypothetical protein